MGTFAFATEVTLAWDPNIEEDLAGYIVYYGTSSRDYTHDVDIGNHTSCTISGFEDGITYFFAVTAYDEDGNESAFSNEDCYPDCPQAASSSDGGGCFITTTQQKSVPWVFILCFIVFLVVFFAKKSTFMG